MYEEDCRFNPIQEAIQNCKDEEEFADMYNINKYYIKNMSEVDLSNDVENIYYGLHWLTNRIFSSNNNKTVTSSSNSINNSPTNSAGANKSASNLIEVRSLVLSSDSSGIQPHRSSAFSDSLLKRKGVAFFGEFFT